MPVASPQPDFSMKFLALVIDTSVIDLYNRRPVKVPARSAKLGVAALCGPSQYGTSGTLGTQFGFAVSEGQRTIPSSITKAVDKMSV